MLSTVGLIERVPVPASRREHYRLRDDAVLDPAVRGKALGVPRGTTRIGQAKAK